MFRVLLIGVALVIGPSAATTATPATAQSFSLVLESSPTGWAARCDSGCRWQRLSFGCERACGAIIDANGVAILASQALDSATFRFRVERTLTGIRATGRSGTAWQTLTWTCRLDPCRARVDTYGVSQIDRAR
jgi:hypothetical protein